MMRSLLFKYSAGSDHASLNVSIQQCNGTLVLQQAAATDISLAIYSARTLCLWSQLSSSQFLFQGKEK